MLVAALIINAVAYVIWKLFTKQLQESVGELLLTVILLGTATATFLPMYIETVQAEYHVPLEGQEEEVAVATKQ